MKKIFLITAILALGAATLAGCGAGSNDKPTTEESADGRIRITAEETAPDANETPDTENNGDKRPDDNCPDCKHPNQKQPREGRVGHIHEFIFRFPENVKDDGAPAERGTRTDGANDETKPEKTQKGKKRDNRPPFLRMPKPEPQIEPGN